MMKYYCTICPYVGGYQSNSKKAMRNHLLKKHKIKITEDFIGEY